MTQPHIIGRQIIDLVIDEEREAFRIQDEIGEVFRTRVTPAMSVVLDQYTDPDVVVRLERLELDIGRIDTDQFDETFAANVCDALETELTRTLATALPAAAGCEPMSKKEHVLALWHHVMLRGHLPWWAPPAAATDLEARVDQVLETLGSLPHETRSILRSNPAVIRRLALQGSDRLLKRILNFADGDFAAVCLPAFDAVAGLLNKHPIAPLRGDSLRRNFWLASLTECFHPTARTMESRSLNVLCEAFEATIAGASLTHKELMFHLQPFIEPSIATGELASIPAATRQTLRSVLSSFTGSPDRPPFAPPGDRRQAADALAGAPADHETTQGPEATQEPSPGQNRNAGMTSTRGASTDRGLRASIHDANDGRGETLERSADESSQIAREDRRWARHKAPAFHAGDTVYVDDAGIVLLHPFLRMHFEKLNLWREGVFVSEIYREAAVHQLRYLATGEQEMPEYALVLPKILCGLTPDDPIARMISLDERARSEADSLLKAVIRHWGALKNSSPDGLRETFLRREGRLTLTSDGWRLRVESRSYDLLLNRLPWPLSVISLPWMPELFRVEWT